MSQTASGPLDPRLDRLTRGRSERLLHVESSAPRAARIAAWPAWVPDQLRAALAERGITDLYLLGSCKQVIGTKGSSFSHMAGIMAGKLEWVEGSSRSQKDWEG